MPEGMDPHMEEQIREIAKDEARKAVASLSGLVMRRSQEARLTRLGERNVATDVVNDKLAEIFGEALQQFTDKWPGEEKVEDASS